MEFLSWMKRIMDRFDLLGQDISESKNNLSSIDGEELLDNQDVLQMLKISNRSLQRYRSSGKLPYYTISGKLYYKLSDVHQFIRDSFAASSSKTKAKKWQWKSRDTFTINGMHIAYTLVFKFLNISDYGKRNTN